MLQAEGDPRADLASKWSDDFRLDEWNLAGSNREDSQAQLAAKDKIGEAIGIVLSQKKWWTYASIDSATLSKRRANTTINKWAVRSIEEQFHAVQSPSALQYVAVTFFIRVKGVSFEPIDAQHPEKALVDFAGLMNQNVTALYVDWTPGDLRSNGIDPVL